MTRLAFIKTIVKLLIQMDQGPQEFEFPLPSGVREHLIDVIAAFGDESIEVLHSTLSRLQHEGNNPLSLIDALGIIGNPSSIPYLIDQHRNYSNFMSGEATISALRKTKNVSAYEYISKILIARSLGNYRVFNSEFEIVIACKALGEWGDDRAVEPLESALKIKNTSGMPQIAIEEIARYEKARPILENLAESEKELSDYISKFLAHG
jgi:HEAT repeat protein